MGNYRLALPCFDWKTTKKKTAKLPLRSLFISNAEIILEIKIYIHTSFFFKIQFHINRIKGYTGVSNKLL